MAYDLPYQVFSFYNIPIWPGSTGHKSRRSLWLQADIIKQNRTSYEFFSKYVQKSAKHGHPKDFSAGELYEGIEDLLLNYGFHETCLLRTVCELARHPFNENHVLANFITFILTPSLHDGFLESEQIYKEAYENAELQGFLGKNCAFLYEDCKRDFLQILTVVSLH